MAAGARGNDHRRCKRMNGYPAGWVLLPWRAGQQGLYVGELLDLRLQRLMLNRWGRSVRGHKRVALWRPRERPLSTQCRSFPRLSANGGFWQELPITSHCSLFRLQETGRSAMGFLADQGSQAKAPKLQCNCHNTLLTNHGIDPLRCSAELMSAVRTRLCRSRIRAANNGSVDG